MDLDKNLYNRMNIGMLMLLFILISMIILVKFSKNSETTVKIKCINGIQYSDFNKEFFKAEKNKNGDFIKCSE